MKNLLAWQKPLFSAPKGVIMEKQVKIKIRNLYKIFGPRPKTALDMYLKKKSKTEILSKTKSTLGVCDVSFDIYQGETLVIMGLSGSGKSTLLRCLNRLHETTRGSIIMDGQDIVKMDYQEVLEMRRHKISMVFQKFALFPHKTVLENVEFGLEIQNISESLRKERAQKALEQVGLKGWDQFYSPQLSGGMQQRVGLARALAVNPDVLLMDEPFSALDPLIRTDMQDELLPLRKNIQKTIIFVTHDLAEAIKLGDRIVIMKDGELIQIGTPKEILLSPGTSYVEKFVESIDVERALESIERNP